MWCFLVFPLYLCTIQVQESAICNHYHGFWAAELFFLYPVLGFQGDSVEGGGVSLLVCSSTENGDT